MKIEDKIAILANGAKYDVSCSSSGSQRGPQQGQLGHTTAPGICHSWSEDGRCISLLKILMSNDCIYNCAYCVNRAEEDTPRTTLTPEELIRLTIGFYRRNYIEGLFLSSAVIQSPDYTMEQMLLVVKGLRLKAGFNGYIHLKGIPGCSKALIDEAGKYVDRMSFNLEIPTEQRLMLLAPQKRYSDIVQPMDHLAHKIVQNVKPSYTGRFQEPFTPAGQTSQMMVGTGEDSDLLIMKQADFMYKSYSMKRVYYSAYIPVVQNNALLPKNVQAPLTREHRLYQADWLLRFYGFNVDELLDSQHDHFDLWIDPKAYWALRNIAVFPIEITKANYDTLLRIPGIGPTSAKRIIESRRHSGITVEGLKKIGVVLKRAQYFISINGKKLTQFDVNLDQMHMYLSQSEKQLSGMVAGQVSLLETDASICEALLRV